MTDSIDTIPLEARLKLTRRGFLKTSAAGALALAYGPGVLDGMIAANLPV